MACRRGALFSFDTGFPGDLADAGNLGLDVIAELLRRAGHDLRSHAGDGGFANPPSPAWDRRSWPARRSSSAITSRPRLPASARSPGKPVSKLNSAPRRHAILAARYGLSAMSYGPQARHALSGTVCLRRLI